VVKAGRFCAKPDRDSPKSKKVNAAFTTMVLLVAMLLKSCRMDGPSCGHHAGQAKSAQCTAGKLAINRESSEDQVVSIESCLPFLISVIRVYRWQGFGFCDRGENRGSPESPLLAFWGGISAMTRDHGDDAGRFCC
jgi:hypothetical protein